MIVPSSRAVKRFAATPLSRVSAVTFSAIIVSIASDFKDKGLVAIGWPAVGDACGKSREQLVALVREHKDKGVVAIGWPAVGDASGKSREQLVALVREHNGEKGAPGNAGMNLPVRQRAAAWGVDSQRIETTNRRRLRPVGTGIAEARGKNRVGRGMEDAVDSAPTGPTRVATLGDRVRT